MTTRTDSSILFTTCYKEEQILNCCRLIHTVDIFHGDDVFSIFLTTNQNGELDEEFVYDIARDEKTAKQFFARICREHVTACTLHDVVKDFLAEL